MSQEEPNQPTPEDQAKIETERTLSDAEMIKDGAEYVVDEGGDKRLEATSEQVESAREEMERAEELKSSIEGVIEQDENYGSEVSSTDEVFSRLAKEDSELQTALSTHYKWGDHFNSLGGKTEKNAKRLQLIGGIGGTTVAVVGSSLGTTVLAGGLLMNPVTLGGLAVAGVSVGVGEAIKMYRRYKERKSEEKRDKEFDRVNNEAIAQARGEG